ncbi:unnamed protein product [Vicia faba]|uniref:Uncharacterized protein n=1 Tax=Vicia faba TaxID=3906 RepID=A0AAV1A5U8_VICFA|nr:unnamed protein product [Vicia faba]
MKQQKKLKPSSLISSLTISDSISAVPLKVSSQDLGANVHGVSGPSVATRKSKKDEDQGEIGDNQLRNGGVFWCLLQSEVTNETKRNPILAAIPSGICSI